MESGKGEPLPLLRRHGFLYWLGCSLCLAAGCAASRSTVPQGLRVESLSVQPPGAAAENYAVGCPDMLEVLVDGRPRLGGQREVGPDGRIHLGEAGAPRVEGLTLHECEREIAAELEVPPPRVHVRVAQFKSQQIYLTGQIAGLQRTLPYCGQEPVVDVVKRAGGITADAAPDDLYLVRAHVDEGRQPEVFHIDLHAILDKHDFHTNIPVQPFDQIYIAETHQSRLKKCFAPCLRPFYAAVCRFWQPRSQAGKMPKAEK
jgi:protein involved in polysaccharide export with SLBB domain